MRFSRRGLPFCARHRMEVDIEIKIGSQDWSKLHLMIRILGAAAPDDVIQAEDAVMKAVLEKEDVMKNIQFENPTSPFMHDEPDERGDTTNLSGTAQKFNYNDKNISVNSPHISHSSDSDIEILENNSTSPSSIEICDLTDSGELTDSVRIPSNIKENTQDDAAALNEEFNAKSTSKLNTNMPSVSSNDTASCGEDTFAKNILRYTPFHKFLLSQEATFGKKNNAKVSSNIYLALESFPCGSLADDLDNKNYHSAIPELITLCNKHLRHLENQENKDISKITPVEKFQKRLNAVNTLIKNPKFSEYRKMNDGKISVCGPDRSISLGRLNTTSTSLLQPASYDTIQNSNIEPEFSKRKSVLKTKRNSSTEKKSNHVTSNIYSNSFKSGTLSYKKRDKLNNCFQRLKIMKEPEKVQMLRDSEFSVSMPSNRSEVLSQKHLFSESQETAAISKSVPPSNQSVISSTYQEPLNFPQSSHTIHYISEKEQQFAFSKPSVPLGNQRTISSAYQEPLNLSQTFHNRHYNSGLRPPSSSLPPQIPCPVQGHDQCSESLQVFSPAFSLPPPFQRNATVSPHHDVAPTRSSTSDTVVRSRDREAHSSSQPNSFVQSSVAVRTDISFSERQISLVHPLCDPLYQSFINYRNLYAQNAMPENISNTHSIQNTISAYNSSQSYPLMPCDSSAVTPSFPSSNFLHPTAQLSSNVTRSTYRFPHLTPTVVPSSANFQPSSIVSRSPHALNIRPSSSSNLETLRQWALNASNR